MNEIYTITTLTNSGIDMSRCFGFFFSESAAREAALNNQGSMQECLYKYLVIEKQGDGIHAHAEDIQWYIWIHTDKENWDGYWYECSRPKGERFDNITNFNCVG
jgi:hypothetical protein